MSEFNPNIFQFIISGLTFIGVILTALINKIANDKIMNNHLFHIAEDVKTIKEVQSVHGDSIRNVELKVATLEGKQATIETFAKKSRNVASKKI